MAFKTTERDYPKWVALQAEREQADATFTLLLAMTHGDKAGDYRYQPKRDTAELKAARHAYHTTCDAVQAFLA